MLLNLDSKRLVLQSITSCYIVCCRERVIHLLAVRAYKKPELILRLQRGLYSISLVVVVAVVTSPLSIYYIRSPIPQIDEYNVLLLCHGSRPKYYQSSASSVILGVCFREHDHTGPRSTMYMFENLRHPWIYQNCFEYCCRSFCSAVSDVGSINMNLILHEKRRFVGLEPLHKICVAYCHQTEI